MAIVVIAEKPSVAQDIAKAWCNQKTDTHWDSDDLVITWAVGHLLELKTPEEYDDRLKDWRKSVELLLLFLRNLNLNQVVVEVIIENN